MVTLAMLILQVNQLLKTPFSISRDFLAFNTTDWDAFVDKMSNRWFRHYHRYITESDNLGIPLKIIYYENLQADSVSEMKSLLEFLEGAIGFQPDRKSQRLHCISMVDTLKFLS